jgi:hypothetical protein
MSLNQCHDCSHTVSDRALACPQCGRMVRGRGWWAFTIGWGVIASAMISFILMLLVTFGLILLAGGGTALSYYLNRPQTMGAPRPAATPFR